MHKKTGGWLLTGWAAVGALGALGASLAMPAWAAEAPPAPSASSDTDLTEVIVTARRVEENLQDVPISITVFNQEQLSNRNIVLAQDLAAYVPSLSVSTNFGSENSSFAIRGFVQETGTAPSVGVFFADVIAPRAASNGLPGGDGAGPGSFFDLENVQILKGPQGTLFGRNTTGGDILLVPKKPTSELSGFVEGGVGNYDDGAFQAVGNLPLGENLRLRAGVIRETREGYLHSNSGVGPKDFDDIDYWAARLSAVWDIMANLENYTIGSFSTTNNHGSLNKLIAVDPSPSNIPFGDVATAQLQAQGSGFYNIQQDLQDPISRLQQWQVINTTTWKATDELTVKNIASYAQLRDYFNNGIFATAFVTPGSGIYTGLPTGIPFGFAASRPYPGSLTAAERTITEELQFQGNALDQRLTWQGGGYFETAIPMGVVGSLSPVTASCISYNDFNCTDIVGAAIKNTFNFTTPVAAENETIGETRFRDYAFYAQGTYKIIDPLKVTAGFRWTEDHQETDSIQKTYHFNQYPAYGLLPGVNPKCTDVNATLPSCQVDYSTDSHAPTWLLDFDYTPVQDLLTYVKYSRGYREGTIAPTAPPPLNIIQPEKVDAYEIGEKTSFRGAVSGTFNMAAFYNDFRNQQIQIGYNAPPLSGFGPFAAPANVGKSRIWGVELDSSLKLFPRFRLDVGYTYLDTRIEQVTIPTLAPGSPYTISGTFQVGDPILLSPKNKVSTTGTYTLPFPDTIGTVNFGATFTYTSSQLVNYSDRYNPPFAQYSYIGATGLLNLNLGWDDIMHAPVDVSMFATNITNKQYYTFVAGLGGNGGPGFETAAVGPPMMFGVRVRLRFH
jgi:iron complex outermembrane receptor protein